jgi:hypothetical protein
LPIAGAHQCHPHNHRSDFEFQVPVYQITHLPNLSLSAPPRLRGEILLLPLLLPLLLLLPIANCQLLVLTSVIRAIAVQILNFQLLIYQITHLPNLSLSPRLRASVVRFCSSPSLAASS